MKKLNKATRHRHIKCIADMTKILEVSNEDDIN